MNALETGDSLNIFAYRRIALLEHCLYIYCTKMKPGLPPRTHFGIAAHKTVKFTRH